MTERQHATPGTPGQTAESGERIQTRLDRLADITRTPVLDGEVELTFTDQGQQFRMNIKRNLKPPFAQSDGVCMTLDRISEGEYTGVLPGKLSTSSGTDSLELLTDRQFESLTTLVEHAPYNPTVSSYQIRMGGLAIDRNGTISGKLDPDIYPRYFLGGIITTSVKHLLQQSQVGVDGFIHDEFVADAVLELFHTLQTDQFRFINPEIHQSLEPFLTGLIKLFLSYHMSISRFSNDTGFRQASGRIGEEIHDQLVRYNHKFSSIIESLAYRYISADLIAVKDFGNFSVVIIRFLSELLTRDPEATLQSLLKHEDRYKHIVLASVAKNLQLYRDFDLLFGSILYSDTHGSLVSEIVPSDQFQRVLKAIEDRKLLSVLIFSELYIRYREDCEVFDQESLIEQKQVVENWLAENDPDQHEYSRRINSCKKKAWLKMEESKKKVFYIYRQMLADFFGQETESQIKLQVRNEYDPVRALVLGDPSSIQHYDPHNPGMLASFATVDTPLAESLKKEFDARRIYLASVGTSIFSPYTTLDILRLIAMRDVAVVIGDTVVIANMTVPNRRAEITALEHIWDQIGCPKTDTGQRLNMIAVPAEIKWEGGDVMPHNGTIFIGIGSKRTDRAIAYFFTRNFGPKGWRVEIVEINDEIKGTHMDMAFKPLGDNLAVVYPPAITNMDMVRRYFPDVIELTAEEHELGGGNIYSLDSSMVMVSDHPCLKGLRDRIWAKGILPIPVPSSELFKTGTGPCNCPIFTIMRG